MCECEFRRGDECGLNDHGRTGANLSTARDGVHGDHPDDP